MESKIMVDDTLKADLETLRGARVFFGHHSVGANILEGLGALEREAGVELALGEGPVGENMNPLAKFEDFARHAESAAAEGEQLMLMKLCYVDFNPQTDTKALVEAYAKVVERVRKARPAAKLVHVTPPLCARATDMKSKLKRTLGKSVWEDDANARRAEYREKLLARFPGEPVLDISLLESTRPDGSREVHEVGGQSVPMLWPGYTNDGGHLNEAGQRMAAKAFARVLASALRK
ncbi:MAG: hypothetical protein IPJ19_18220 [Planctomycetes bacterium]|nr:hypothetical protein [Planctomycetota bacterium]